MLPETFFSRARPCALMFHNRRRNNLPLRIAPRACHNDPAALLENNEPDQAQLERMTARFAPTEIIADVSKLSPNDRKVLAKLVEASQIVDGIFLRQAWSGNPSMLLDLAGDDSAEGRARLHYFLINKGPWSRLDHNEPFVLGAPPKPEGAAFTRPTRPRPRSNLGSNLFRR